MKIVHINTVPNGSTGSIMMSIHEGLLKLGHESYVVWGRGRKEVNEHEIFMNDKMGVYFHVLYSRILDKCGYGSKNSTKKLLNKLDELKPEIIHLHNLHGYYINIELLFKYIKNNNIKVVWTLHDCWGFTGHCTHFVYSNCKKWEKKCYDCPLNKSYPSSLLDFSKRNFNKKRELFTSINDLLIVTPSQWLKKEVERSFLNKYECRVINNGIDISKFKKDSNEKIKDKYKLKNKILLLGIASPWIEKKGLNDFLLLNELMDKNKYKIMLVGLSEKQINYLPNDIIKIKRTSNVEELIEIYNGVDYLVNPTYEDNYPTINIESIACGTPVVTYDTGGSPEILSNNKYGIVVKKKSNQYCNENVLSLLNELQNVKLNKKNMPLIPTQLIDKNEMIKKYIDIYTEMAGDKK